MNATKEPLICRRKKLLWRDLSLKDISWAILGLAAVKNLICSALFPNSVAYNKNP